MRSKKVEYEAIPKVDERIHSIENGTGPGSGMKAYDKINRMLMEDNGTGAIIKGKNKIYSSPGKKKILLNPW